MRLLVIALIGVLVSSSFIQSLAADNAAGANVRAEIPKGADPAAWNLLKRAHDSRQVLPEDFKGFDADLVFHDDEKTYKGTLALRPGAKAKIDVAGLNEEQRDWFTDKLLSLIGHRRGGDFAKRDGKNPITFGPKDDSPYGTLVELHDQLNSKYRVKDNKVTEVTRTAGDETFTISVFETVDADPGKYLATHFVVAYRGAKDGDLNQVDGFRDSYHKVDKVWLPQTRTVLTVTKENISPRTRRIALTNVKLAGSAGK